jgi:DNA-3-methyladenine glycosylase
MISKLQKDFFKYDLLTVAQELLGKILVHETDQGTISGRIIEVEAYQADLDKSAHSYKGKTKRNKSLYLEAGYLYLFKIHRYICMDIVTGEKGEPNSVLLRSLEPIEGIELMKENRDKEKLTELTTGPGKLVQALDIPFKYDGYDICQPNSKIYIVDDGYKVEEKVQTTRIGISKAKDLPNRFYIKNNPYISKK